MSVPEDRGRLFSMLHSTAQVSIERIRQVAQRLGPTLLEQVVFLGGAALALLITDPAAPEVRSTKDVDVIVETLTLGAYYGIADALRTRGFKEDQPDTAQDAAPLICRWHIDNLVVDVMPTDEKILGFSNRWYPEAYHKAVSVPLPHQAGATGSEVSVEQASAWEPRSIRLVTAPYFLATKIEAFRGRGKGDLFASHDMEDIVTLIDGREELAEEVRSDTEGQLPIVLAEFFSALLMDPSVSDAVEGNLADRNRTELVLERMRTLA